MAVFDGVCYSLSSSLSPTRRNELAAVLDLNGAAPHPPYTHLIAPAASYAHNNATSNPAIKLVTDRWVDRSVVMGKRQPEQYYSPDPSMIFSGVVACATDLSAADLEVLSAGITSLGGQWRVGLTRDVTHLFALRTGSDKYNTALHFAPQTHMCILTPHWFDDAVRLGRRIPETPYTWPDPPVLRPGMTLDLDEDVLAADTKRKRKPPTDTNAETGDDVNAPNQGEHVWASRRILLSTSLELADGSRRAIEARIQRAGGVIVHIPDDADEGAELKAVDEADVLITRWRGGKSYFKAARASLFIGTLSWLFSVESSGTLHSPLDSLLWYPTPRGGIPDLIDCEISITNYTGAARDYLKRLISLVGAKFTPSMSQSNKVLIAGFQPSPKTTRALSWSIPVVNHTWLEDCFVEWRALTVGLERYIVYPPGVDFGKILMTRQDGPAPSPQSVPPPNLSGGAVPGGRGIGAIDVEQEESRDEEYRARSRQGRGVFGLSTPHEAVENATTADGMSVLDIDVLAGSRVQAGSVKTPSSAARMRRGSVSTAMGAFVDHVIELPPDDDGADGKQRTPGSGKQRARTTSAGARASMSGPSSTGLFSTPKEVGVVRNSGEKLKDGYDKEKGKRKADTGIGSVQPTEEVENEGVPRRVRSPKPRPKSRAVQHGVEAARTDDGAELQAAARMSASRKRRPAKTTIRCDLDSRSEASEESEASVPPRRPAGASMTPVKSGMKPKSKSNVQTRPGSALGGESEERNALSAGSGSAAGKRQEEVVKPTRKEGRMIEERVKEKGKADEAKKEAKKVEPRPRSPTRSPSPTSQDAKNSRMSKRRLSVVVPSVPKEYFSSRDAREMESTRDIPKSAGATSGTKRKQFASIASVNTVAARGKPSPAKMVSVSIPASSKSKPQPQAKPKSRLKLGSGPSKEKTKARTDDKDIGEEEEDNGSSMIVDAPVASTSRVGPRRSAASKATTRLRDEIMPDVISFEKERKQAKRRRSAGGESVVSAREEEEEEEEESEVRVGKRRKVAAKEDEEGAEVSSIRAKLKPINGKGKEREVGSDRDTDDVPAKNKPGGGKGTRGRGKELAAVRLMTTGVSLSDDIVKRLTKLGVQMTTKPADCTHLIAKGIVRTEKFLCAMPALPYVLTEEWASASAKSGKLLLERDYLLSDLAAEKKWAFKLADAMTRAKGPAGGSNLFKEMTFYVTPKVSVDAKLLKNVISAGGGQVQTSTMPTVRVLNGKGKRYVISCQEDKGIWRPLAQEGFKIYSPELVLRGALRQEIEWDKDECLVTG